MRKLKTALTNAITWGLVAVMFILVVTSAIIRDYLYIVEHPIKFTIEMIFFSVIPSLLITLVFVRTRNIPMNDGIMWFVLMVIKFAIFHVLFQLSGIYAVLLGKLD